MVRLSAWILMGVVVPTALLAALELALRLAGYGFATSFFVPVPGRAEVATNDNFGRRYFPRALARSPVPLAVATPKPDGVYRIFVLGESAAMGFPEPAFGFPRMLEAVLGGRNQVVNAAMTAIDSAVVADIAAECSRLQPDLFVVLMGNNEVVGPHGPGTAFAPTLLQTLRIGQLAFALRKPSGEWRGMEMFLQHRVAADDPRLERVYRDFERNLRRIVALAPRTIVCTVPVNLRDQMPFAGDEARAAYQAGQVERARDLDQLRFRADSRIHSIIRAVAGNSLVDAAPEMVDGRDFYEHVHLRPKGNYRLATKVAHRVRRGGPPPTFEQVRERLALTPWDEQRMENTMAALMSRPPFQGPARKPAAPPDPAESRRIYERAVAVAPGDVQLHLRYAEFLRETGDRARAAVELGKLIDLLPGRKALHAARGSALDGAAAQAEFDRALSLDADFDLAHFGKAVAFERSGETDSALAAYGRAIEWNPDFTEARNNRGLLLARLGRHQDAAREFAECARREPMSAAPAYNQGMELSKLDRSTEALAAFEEAVRRDPAHAPALHARARLLPVGDAILSLKLAVAADPSFAEAHYDLGVLLARQGGLDEAISHYREAIRIAPRADHHNNLGTALARKGNLAGARAAFEAALRLDPGHAAARRNLDLANRGR
jgi:tetratricopeptide (TPR) repeat protein